MRQGAPSNAEQVDAEAWTAMREAARRAGVPLNEWLKSTLLNSARRESALPAAPREEAPAPGMSVPRPAAASEGVVGDLQRRVQDLAGEIDRLARIEPPPAPHRGSRVAATRGEGLVTALDALNARVAKLLQDPEKGIPAAATHLDETIRRLNERLETMAIEKRAGDRPADGFERRVSEIARTVEALNRKLERGVETAPAAAHAPARPAADASGYQAPVLDAAVAEIVARQRSLEDFAASRRAAAPMPEDRAVKPAAAEPAREAGVNLSGLERQLNIIADQMQELRRAAPKGEAVDALHRDLDEMKRSLGDLAPRRAVEDLERAVTMIADRIERSDASAANAEIGRALVEVRNMMAELRPPESPLALLTEVEALSRKLDIVSAKTVDGATVARLQAQTAEIRDLLGRALSNDAVRMLAEQVELLVGKIDRFASPADMVRDVVAALEHRIDALGERIAANFDEAVDAAPFQDILRRLDELQLAVVSAVHAAPKGMEALFDGLIARIERILPSVSPDGSFEALGRQIAGIADKIDASDSRFAQLAGIERALGDLFVQMEEARASTIAAAEESARSAAAEFADLALSAEGVASIKRGLADLEARQDTTERRTFDTLEAVHQTLERVVDRIASSNATGPAERMPLDDAQPHERDYLARYEIDPDVDAGPDGDVDADFAGPVAESSYRAPEISVAARPLPEEPALPDDFPLEPGSGAPRQRVASAAARIAQSQAAVENLVPGADENADEAGPSRADFIAAARRAAQTAASGKPEKDETGGRSEASSRLSKLLSRARITLLVGVCGGAMALGSWQLLGSMRDGRLNALFPAESTPAATPAATPSASMAGPMANVPSSGVLGASQPLVPGQTPVGNGSGVAGSDAIGDVINTLGSIHGGSGGDITGSIGRAAPAPAAAPASAAAPAPSPTPAPGTSPSSSATPSDLPAGIGSQALRTAALAGDPAAAYEVGARLADGKGASANPALAARWFEFAMNRGSIPATYRLAALLENGADGLTRNVERARALYEKAAEAGNVRAMHNFAVLIAEGVDGQPDYQHAAIWFRKAAERGLRDSQYNLGVLCARGLGVTTDLEESWKWFALAASQGDSDAGRKRDEIAARLDPQKLVAMRFAVQTWTPVMSDDKANVALSNPDWDRAEAPTKRKTASRT